MTKRGGTADSGGNGGDRRKSRRPVNAETRLAIEEACREAIASGVGTRNSIARAFEVSPATVSNICKQAQPPIVWDRSATKAAVAARTVDLKARRQRISEGLLDDIDRMREMLFTPQKRLDRTGRVVTIPPDPNDLKNLLIAVGIALDKHGMLARFDSDDRDMAAVDQWLAHITNGGDT